MLLVGDTDEAELHLQQSVEIGEQLGWQSSIACTSGFTSAADAEPRVIFFYVPHRTPRTMT
ncbi:MAG TPA: hypothetical protein VFY27_12400 [Woeseiaceae bacterium]|nr:hypothetical protein [Woeseiaceae bacterium]